MKKILWVFIIFLMAFPVLAKKKKEEGLKKVIAVGAVNTGTLSFQNDSPTGLSTLLQDKVKKQLEKTGHYAAVIVDSAKEAGVQNSDSEFMAKMQAKQDVGEELTPQESLKYSEMAMKQQMAALGPLMQQFGGGGAAAHQPVAAQALLTFAVNTGQGGMDTGGVVGTVGDIFGSSLGGGVVGDFGTQSAKLSLTCVLQDPDTGNVIDQNIVQTKSTQFTRLGGFSTVADSTNQDQAYDKLFGKAVEKCVKWLDQKIGKQAWEGRIFKVEGGRVLLNAGSNAGVKEGMQFDLIERGQVSGGGIEFGKEDRLIGTASALDVQSGYTVLGAGAPAKVGTIVKPRVASPEEAKSR